jgi:hypothetical protein
MIYDEKTQLIFPFSSIRKNNTFKLLSILSIKGVLPNLHHMQLSHVNNQPSGSKKTNFFTAEEKKDIFSKHHSGEVQGTRSPTMPFPRLLLTPCTVFFSPTIRCASHNYTIVSCAS